MLIPVYDWDMTLRIRTFLAGLLALLMALLLALAPVASKPAAGRYQLFEGVASGDQVAISLASLENFDYQAKIAPECCNEGIAGDVGGHGRACRHGGTCDRYNLFPQNSNFNNREYKKWEYQITRAVEKGDQVGPITRRYERADPGNRRPDRLDIEFSINGVPETRRFINQAGGGR